MGIIYISDKIVIERLHISILQQFARTRDDVERNR